MWEISPIGLALASLVTAAASFVQASIGFGFAVLSVPLVSLIDSRLAPVPQLLVVAPLTLGMLWRERGAVDLRGVGWVLLGRFPGAAFGLALLRLGSQGVVDLLIAACVLIAVVIVGSGVEVRRTPLTEIAAGLLSGTSALVASIGGPPLALLYSEDRGATLRASLAAIFSIGVVITVSARLLDHRITILDAKLAAFLLPALLSGLWASRFVLGRIEGRLLKRSILAVATVAAAGLVLRAALGGR